MLFPHKPPFPDPIPEPHPTPPKTRQQPPETDRNGPETDRNRSNSIWTFFKLSGVGPGRVVGMGGRGVVTEKENHYKTWSKMGLSGLPETGSKIGQTYINFTCSCCHLNFVKEFPRFGRKILAKIGESRLKSANLG